MSVIINEERDNTIPANHLNLEEFTPSNPSLSSSTFIGTYFFKFSIIK